MRRMIKSGSHFLLLLLAGICLACVLPAAGHAKSAEGSDTAIEGIPWNLEELGRAPEYEWGEGKEIRSLYYKGEPYKGRPTRVFAYYATPGTLSGDLSKDKNLPAIVLVHGGNGTAFAEWVRLWASRGYAAIAMDLAGCGPDKTKLDDGGPGQTDNDKFGAMDEPVTDQWTYHAVANVIRAHSLLRSFHEVDPDRTAITGISWGGYLTCIVAGLDHRFKAAVPVYGCGFLHENSVWLENFKKMPDENRERWIKLFDPSMYVGSATMPMLFVNGGKDFAYPPDSYARTYSLVRAPTNLHFVPKLKHGHIFDRPRAIEVFIDHHMNDGIPLAKITSLRCENGQVTAIVDADTKLVNAELHYTLDDLSEDPKTRKWITRPAMIEKDRIIADLPPADSTVWFLTLKDVRNTLVSSQLVL